MIKGSKLRLKTFEPRMARKTLRELINRKVKFQTEKFRRKQKFKNLIRLILEI
jgi:hypothetical protein